MALDPKEKWENRRKNWKSRAHLQEKREENLRKFAETQAVEVAPELSQPEPVFEAEIIRLPETEPKPQQAEPPKKRNGEIGIGIVVNGKLLFIELFWRGMEGAVMPTKLNERDLREMFKKALSTLGRIE
jgi:hypothetical protein